MLAPCGEMRWLGTGPWGLRAGCSRPSLAERCCSGYARNCIQQIQRFEYISKILLLTLVSGLFPPHQAVGSSLGSDIQLLAYESIFKSMACILPT